MFDGGEAQRMIGELVAAMTSAAGEALGAAARFDLSHLTDEALLSTVQALEAVRRSLDATVGHALVQMQERGTTVRGEALATSTWLARESRQAPGVARERLRGALRLGRDLPLVDEALVDGRLGWQHVEVFACATNCRNAEAMHEASPRAVRPGRATRVRGVARGSHGGGPAVGSGWRRAWGTRAQPPERVADPARRVRAR